jgi:chemotaxis protein methyltransferase CheR
MTEWLTALTELIRRETGMRVQAGESVLRSALRRAAPGLEPAGFLSAASEPIRGRHLVDRLIDEVTVQETAFARDRFQLDAIPWHGLLASARAAGAARIRVWSAGCATGEEPYTLALLATEAFAPAPPPVDVLGTDISRAALTAAAAGRYRERAVRAVGATARHRYLERQPDGDYLVTGRLRGLVRFRHHNLARDPVPPPGEVAFDLVICRNVLIYFDAAASERIIRLLDGAVRPGGKLLLGATDALRRAAGTGLADTTPEDGGAGSAAADGGPGDATWGVRGVADTTPGGGRETARRCEERLATALAAAGRGDTAGALARMVPLVAADPLDADAHFVHGLVTLGSGQPARAAAAFRRAVYADPAFALAAFGLGRALDAAGDRAGARRAYEQALRTLDPADDRHDALLQQIDIGDIAAACRARLR